MSATGDLRWDLLEYDLPAAGRLTVRVAVPGKSVDVYIGVDDSLRRSLLIRIPSGEPTLISERASRGIALQMVEMRVPESDRCETFIEVICLDVQGHAALDMVTEEIVEAICAGESIGRVRLLQNVLARWRQFWSGVSVEILSREQQLGLFGELWFLSQWLFPALRTERSVQMWRGPLGSRHDFEDVGWSVEVKTSSKVDGSHHINGVEQLLDLPDAKLFLFSLVVREEGGSANSLPNVIEGIRVQLANDSLISSRFEGMLAAAGYDDASVAEYLKLRVRIRSEALFHVDHGFPRIVPSSFVNGLPVGVSNVSYDLRPESAVPWIVGENPVAGKELFVGLASLPTSAP